MFSLQSKCLANFHPPLLNRHLSHQHTQQQTTIATLFTLYLQSLPRTSPLASLPLPLLSSLFFDSYTLVSNRSFSFFNEINLIPVLDCFNHAGANNVGIVAVNVYFELCPVLYYEWREEVREEWEEEGGVGVEVGQYDFVGGVVELGVLGLDRGQKGRT